MAETILELRQIRKRFGNTPVLQGIDLTISRGEFLTLLGASGCGKTTTLRIIAGLERPDSGSVLLDGQDVTDLAPNKRDVNTVFQSYALFPHMNVEENIAYSLRLRRRPKQEIRRAVEEVLALVRLSGYERRRPGELSGGQRQRVAIARALVNRPGVLLLDEPLGALDLQLRRQMQLELKALQKQLGISFVYITHDQEEALTMSDRIAVMREGRLEQVGTPAEIYNRPRTGYVARFVGEANLLTGVVRSVEGETLTLSCAGGCIQALRGDHLCTPGETVTLALRSESVAVSHESGEGGLSARVREKSFAGGMLRIALELSDGTTLIASRHGIDWEAEPGDRVSVNWDAAAAVLVEGERDG